MLGQDRPDTAQELFEAMLPILGLAGAVAFLVFLSRPGGALSQADLIDEAEAISSLDRAEGALASVRGCKQRSLTALQVAERQLGRAQIQIKEVDEADVRRSLSNRLSRLGTATTRANRDLTRCITGR